jgi:hypothetical protein
MRQRRQYRILQVAFIYGLIGTAFFGSYVGMRASSFSVATINPNASVGTSSTFWEWIFHDATGFFTIILCCVTFGLACVTYKLYSATVTLAKDAEDAAKRNDRMREVLERTYVSGGGVTIMYYDTSKNRKVSTGVFWIHINNHGRSPAELRQIRYGFGPVGISEMPQLPHYTKTISFVDSIAPGTQGKPTARIGIPYSQEPQALFVRFEYLDTFLNRSCSAGFIVAIESDEEFPVPIAAPPGYTERTEST